MKIFIAGAGAMGSRFGFMLHQAGNEVSLIDGWQDHINAIIENGLEVNYNGQEFNIQIPIYNQKDLDINSKAELIIVFTKAMQLDEMMKDLQPIISKETKILCLLNGLGHEDVIDKYLPAENIYLGNTVWTAGMTGPGKVKLFGTGALELQNIVPGFEKEANEIAEALSSAGLNAKYSDDIKFSVYQKACVNGTMNGLCTLLDGNMNEVGATSTSKTMIWKIMEEFRAVADFENINLDLDYIYDKILEFNDINKLGNHYPSMYQDLIINHRKTEIDYINGAISRKGTKYGIPTPYCDFLTDLIHAKEDLLDAK
ncbi:2-dehydropantoate 2-reductase [Floricoccus tropicus]|uniref:2-dehydropantoate 2-reductase n=1 Tax=Floricoccus tropicus TaxID=1859473 RepID=A0A1E8GPW4_9LACT|nr:2-dehydropantoate 2-reductase [Floricoccus tropicus]OFI50285.1 2-dehydropantoate 2-reductase [Floricoccus tropicus]